MTDEAFSGREPCPITAELIARLKARNAFGLNGSSWMMLAEPDPDCQEAADAIAAQAQEIARLTQDVKWLKHDPNLQQHQQINLSFLARAEAAEARVWELERKIEVQEMAMDTARSIWEQRIAAKEPTAAPPGPATSS
jgi:hypothetical protein